MKSVIKKATFSAFILVILINSVLGINLDISKKEISTTVLTDLKKPAIFDFTIKNNEKSDIFEIYSLVGIDINPENFTLNTDETKTITFYFMPSESLSQKKESLPFVYQIKNSKNEIYKDTITITIMDLESAISIIPENINPQSSFINIEIKNRADHDFDLLTLDFGSVFFENYKTSIQLKSLETKTISIPLNKAKLKTLDAGSYILTVYIKTSEKEIKKEGLIKFVERANIETEHKTEGFLIKKDEIVKKNNGNTRERVQIVVKKNFFSYLFTTFTSSKGVSSFDIKKDGFKRIYVWEKELIPNDELEVTVTTNWLFPFFILIFIIIVIWSIKKYIEKDLVFRKTVSYVRTRGGEFALRINLKIKAKRYIEKIDLIDKIPPLVNLYEKFGAIPPNRIDLENRRLEWNISSMNVGEERIFSYIIYSSKVGVVGKFELPSAKVIYEKNGKIKEATSNRSFFVNEPKQKSSKLLYISIF